MQWAEYTELSRRLADLQSREAVRKEDLQQRVSAARAAVDQLQRRLVVQREHLLGLGQRLREPQPALDGVTNTGLNDLDEAVRRAREALDQADAEARQAEERGMRPVLLPSMSPTGRNVLVYSASTLAMWLVACGLSSLASNRSAGLVLWSLCGLPALAFFAGYIVISVFARPRMQTLNQVDHMVRIGGLICVLGTVACWLVLLVVTALL
ncbi:hypothetical protein [Actinoplanes siamensis]|uniref:Uncharacterized protein n=1 Tax=Actinoplanes siamensis TaxID=1223317 RepID=A0A919TNU8_9ACTN|nr:hypothetical protein [Actinoplanes siamensis]GIF09159.1 hypothetical protein Asi03nite_66970 [Actinoplanes siamensis]